MDFTFPNFSLDNLFVSEPRPEDLHSFIMNTHINKYSQIQNLGFINRTRYSNMRDTGCYIVIVNAFEESGPNAIFCISKSSFNTNGSVNTLIQTKNEHGDYLEIEWNPGEYPLLLYNYYTKNSRNDKRKYFVVKVLTSF
jgi:hypothetical protein